MRTMFTALMLGCMLLASACSQAPVTSNYYGRDTGVANNYFQQDRLLKF